MKSNRNGNCAIPLLVEGEWPAMISGLTLLVFLVWPAGTIQNSVIEANTEAVVDSAFIVEPSGRETVKPMRELDPPVQSLPSLIPNQGPTIKALANTKLTSIQSLENQSSAAVISALTQRLDDTDPTTRINALESLASFPSINLVSVFTSKLTDPDSGVRKEAITSLASQNSDVAVAVSAIEGMLFDQNKEVRVTAIETLSYFALPQSGPQIASLLTDADPEIRNQAVSALAEIGGKDSIQFLQQARFDSDARVIANAKAVLAELTRDAESDLNRE